MAAIETRGLTHRYGKLTALRDVQLVVPDGSVYALLGRNGAGKTTLLRILAGQLRPTAGHATVLGKDVVGIGVRDRQRIGYVAEGLMPPGWMTLRQLEAYLAPLYATWSAELAGELRRRFELDAARRIGTLSRGEQMKVALLVTLAPAPAVLLMDEPFTGMDVLTKDEIARGLLDSVARAGTTVLIASHDIAELEPLAEWVGFLEGGRLVVSEPLEALYARFSRVQATSSQLAPALASTPAPPPGWHCVESAGRQVRLILEGTRSNGEVEAELRRVLPDAAEVTSDPATLREIFIALALRGDAAHLEVRP